MNIYQSLAVAFGIGAIAGLRSMTPPALVCWAARLRWLDLQNTSLAFLGSVAAVAIFSILALGELIVDKLPSTPNRTAIGPLGVRLLTGALSGAAVSAAAHQLLVLGGILGGVGGVAGAFVGYEIRHRVVDGLKQPDIVIALFEDVIAIGGGSYLVSRF